LAGDTVHFAVSDVHVGIEGWVDYAVLRGDTLRFLAAEFDPGDYLYIRVPDRPQ